MPIHPMHGVQFEVISVIKRRDGRTGVLVELPDHGTLLVPLEWTDRSAPFATPVVHGQVVRVSLQVLRELSRLLDVGRFTESAAEAASRE